MLDRVAAAEYPNVKWGGVDIGLNHAGSLGGHLEPSVLVAAASGDAFGQTLQVLSAVQTRLNVHHAYIRMVKYDITIHTYCWQAMYFASRLQFRSSYL